MTNLQLHQRIAAYALIRDAAGRVLLARAGNSTDVPGRWFLPGGGVEHGEHPHSTVVRETAEETGLSVVVDGLLSVASDASELPSKGILLHTVRLIYTAHVVGGTLSPETDGTTDAVCWVGQAEARDLPLMTFVAQALETK
jgi:8-oxo-dGTP diphosphatase